MAIRLEVCVLLCQGWPTSQRPRATFLTVLQQRATSYIWAHMNITPSLPHSHTYFFIATFIVNITHHQHDNDRTLQGIYCYACYLVGRLVWVIITQNLHETGQSRMVAAQNVLVFECILTCCSKLQALHLKCSKFKW